MAGGKCGGGMGPWDTGDRLDIASRMSSQGMVKQLAKKRWHEK